MALSGQSRDPDLKAIKEIRKSNDQKGRKQSVLGLNKQEKKKNR